MDAPESSTTSAVRAHVAPARARVRALETGHISVIVEEAAGVAD
jgi:hypothetical protein